MGASGGGSVAFDRAADDYDATRTVDPESLARSLDLLEGELRGRGRILEMGVGTGVLALPLAERGLPIVGFDLSAPMLAKLVAKAGGSPPPALLRADAARQPFADASFGAAYVRWVFHLIPSWRTAVAELCRVVRPGGTIVVEPGGYHGGWREVWVRLMEELGDEAAPVGFDMREGPGVLDAAFAEHGAELRPLPVIVERDPGTLRRFFDEVGRRVYSFTWRVADADLERAVGVARAWALERFGDLDAPPSGSHPLNWRAYDLR